jgi:hypothetical protein
MANLRDEIHELMRAKLLLLMDIRYLENKANSENKANNENKANKVENKVVKKQCRRSTARYSKDN